MKNTIAGVDLAKISHSSLSVYEQQSAFKYWDTFPFIRRSHPILSIRQQPFEHYY